VEGLLAGVHLAGWRPVLGPVRLVQEVAELVVSELVANAVLHGWGHVALRLFDTGDGLRIEVEDANPAPPVITEGHANGVGGYGVQIIERLADWGWRPSGEGKIVWAKLRT